MRCDYCNLPFSEEYCPNPVCATMKQQGTSVRIDNFGLAGETPVRQGDLNVYTSESYIRTPKGNEVLFVEELKFDDNGELDNAVQKFHLLPTGRTFLLDGGAYTCGGIRARFRALLDRYLVEHDNALQK